jgi:hypothetical protein
MCGWKDPLEMADSLAGPSPRIAEARMHVQSSRKQHVTMRRGRPLQMHTQEGAPPENKLLTSNHKEQRERITA